MQLFAYLKLMRFDKPIGIMLLLWPTLIALQLTEANQKTWIFFIIGVIIMRSAGCIINDCADRNFDMYVHRTQLRPLVIGKISLINALSVFIVLILIAFILSLQLKFNTICLSVIAVILSIIYPFMKRYYNYPQIILGISFSWSVFMVYVEVLGSISLQSCILFFSVVTWVIAYDTQYAIVDRKYDLSVGLKSTAIKFGNYDRLYILLLDLISLVLFTYLGANLFFILSSLCIVLYQQVLLKNYHPKKCFKAFLSNHYFGMFIFMGFCL